MTKQSADQRRESFEKIYSSHSWGGVSKSGPGSDPVNTREYVEFVNAWLVQRPEIRTIVEVGCGDWSTTRQIQFGEDRDYLGIDIVEAVVRENERKYGTSGIKFMQSDFIGTPPPSADLLIAKDVLQHLSNEATLSFLKSIKGRYKYWLITNDIRKEKHCPLPFGIVYRKSLARSNHDIADGSSRPLQIDRPPFNVRVEQSVEYQNIMAEHPHRIIYTKQIALCPDKAP